MAATSGADGTPGAGSTLVVAEGSKTGAGDESQADGTGRSRGARGTGNSGARKRTGAAALLKGRGGRATPKSGPGAGAGAGAGDSGSSAAARKRRNAAAQQRLSLARDRGASMRLIRDRRSRGGSLLPGSRQDLSAATAAALRGGRRGSGSGLDGLNTPGGTRRRLTDGGDGPLPSRLPRAGEGSGSGDRAGGSSAGRSGAGGNGEHASGYTPGRALDPSMWDDVEISDSESDGEGAGRGIGRTGARRSLTESGGKGAGGTDDADSMLRKLAADDGDGSESEDSDGDLLTSLQQATKAVAAKGKTAAAGQHQGGHKSSGSRRIAPPRLPPLAVHDSPADGGSSGGSRILPSGTASSSARRATVGVGGAAAAPTPAHVLRSRLRKFSFAPGAIRQASDGDGETPLVAGGLDSEGMIPGHRAGASTVWRAVRNHGLEGGNRTRHDVSLSQTVALQQQAKAALLQTFKGMYEDQAEEGDTNSDLDDGTTGSRDASTVGGTSGTDEEDQASLEEATGVEDAFDVFGEGNGYSAGEFPTGETVTQVAGRPIRRTKRKAISGIRTLTKKDMKEWKVAQDLGALVHLLDAHKQGGKGKGGRGRSSSAHDAKDMERDAPASGGKAKHDRSATVQDPATIADLRAFAEDDDEDEDDSVLDQAAVLGKLPAVGAKLSLPGSKSGKGGSGSSEGVKLPPAAAPKLPGSSGR